MIEVLTIHGGYPESYLLHIGQTRYKYDLRVSKAPFDNCQSFTVGSAYQFSNLNNSMVKLTLRKMYELTDKKLMIIDLNKGYFERVKSILKPYYYKMSIKNYVSTNGSKMVMCHVYLDINKI